MRTAPVALLENADLIDRGTAARHQLLTSNPQQIHNLNPKVSLRGERLEKDRHRWTRGAAPSKKKG